MSKHTAAPWHVAGWQGLVHGQERHEGVHVAVWFDDDKLIAPCGMRGDPESEANAKLIAAAPDMLQALHKFVEYERAMDEDNGMAGMLAYAEFSRLAHEAIEKATGEGV